jgi:hypothetical protein
MEWRGGTDRSGTNFTERSTSKLQMRRSWVCATVVAAGLAAVAPSQISSAWQFPQASVPRTTDCSRPLAQDALRGWLRRGVVFRRIRARGSSAVHIGNLVATPGAAWARSLPYRSGYGYLNFSPDESLVAVSYHLNRAVDKVDVVGADGSVRFSVVGSQPAWSPDGTSLAYAYIGRFGLNPEVRVIDANGTNDHTLAKGRDPAWSPDGDRIAYAAASGLWTLRPDGSDERRIFATDQPVYAPRWSHDGRWLAFIKVTDERTSLVRLRLDGTDAKTLVRINGDGGIAAAWSPVANVLAYSVWSRRGDRWVERLGFIGADGRGKRLLPDDGLNKDGPLWSPDGRRIAFTASDSSEAAADWDRLRGEVWLADPRTLGEQRLTYHCQYPLATSDVLRGTHLHDQIEARDGRRESITCGAAADVVFADPDDRVDRTCETVSRG